MIDTLIINGRYPDFDRGEFVRANIGISEGKIVQIGGERPQASKTIDAPGCIVSPGFIDIHMHEENFAEDGERFTIAELMLKMGVTTACGGNCGMQNQRLSRLKQVIRRLGGCPINYVMLAGYNQMRYELGLGHDDSLSAEQRAIMRKLLTEELEEGAFGISFGIEYDPAITYEDMLDALKLLDDDRYLAAAHYRECGIGAVDSVKELIALSEAAGVKFQISHLVSCSAYGQMAASLELIDRSIEKGSLVNYDTYPYNAFSTHIGSEVFEKKSMDQWCEDIGTIMLTQEPYKNQFCTEELLVKARAEYPQMLAVGFIMNEEEITAAINHPYGMVASDAILSCGNGHPRAAGTFPRVLGKYVREEKALSLIDALRKMTLEPAKRLELPSKGKVALGADADLTIFDPETILDGATYDDLYIQPEGIDYVLIAGETAMDHKQVVSDRLGRFLNFHDSFSIPFF